MAAASLLEIAGRNLGFYEDLYKEIDPTSRGTVSAQDAASLLKKSKLGLQALGKIWDLADSQKRGFLDKSGLFVAFKLVALAQNGLDAVLENLKADIGPPNFIGTGSACPSPAFGMSMMMGSHHDPHDEWAIKHADQEKYSKIFDSLGPENGKIGGDKVKPVLLNSGLPQSVLGKIWGLSDIDRDGFLDRDEMAVALHLVYKALENEPVPGVLPLNMVPPSKRGLPSVGRRPSMPVGGVPVLPPPNFNTPRSRTSSVTSVESLGLGWSHMGAHVQPAGGGHSVLQGQSTAQGGPSMSGTPEPHLSGTLNRSLSGTPVPLPTAVKPPAPWIVNKNKWEATFHEADKDFDGMVTGGDVRGLFVQSGLAQNYLAHIWSLVDLNKTGKLNLEQFALAMHLMEQKRESNAEPPASLPPDLIPPSFRPPAAGMTDMGTSTQEATLTDSVVTQGASSGNKELDVLMDEIQLIQRERREVESAMVQLEADMTVKNSEIKNLEVESNTLDSTVKQLDRQKGEATRRLNDLESQKEALQKTLSGLNEKVDFEQHELNSLKLDFESSASSKMSQEAELNEKRGNLAKLREEENRLEVNLQMEKANLDTQAQQHGAIEKRIQQMDTGSSKLKEQTNSMQEKLAKLEELLSSENLENLEKEEASLLAALEQIKLPSVIPNQRHGSWGYQENAFALTAGSSSNYYDEVPSVGISKVGVPNPSMPFAPAAVEDPFKQNDPFGNPSTNGADPFASGDPFGAPSGPVGGFAAADPFASGQVDPFSSSGGLDPFAPAGSKVESPKDPFAPQPTKKGPPRPAPPKGRPVTPKAGLQTPGDPFSSNDPFSGPAQAPAGSDGGFANFADFANFS